jgi:hypothetical protein
MERIGAVLAGLCFIIGLVYAGDFQLVSMVQFLIGFVILWLAIRARWPLISSLVMTIALIPLSAWIIRLLMSGGM